VAEIMPGDAEVLADEDGQYPGWVELQNASTVPVSPANHGLSDEIAQPFKWRFPDLVLGPGQRLIVFTSGKDRRELPIWTRHSRRLLGVASFVIAGAGVVARCFQPGERGDGGRSG
jgi:hypothetical protein